MKEINKTNVLHTERSEFVNTFVSKICPIINIMLSRKY